MWKFKLRVRTLLQFVAVVALILYGASLWSKRQRCLKLALEYEWVAAVRYKLYLSSRSDTGKLETVFAREREQLETETLANADDASDPPGLPLARRRAIIQESQADEMQEMKRREIELLSESALASDLAKAYSRVAKYPWLRYPK